MLCFIIRGRGIWKVNPVSQRSFNYLKDRLDPIPHILVSKREKKKGKGTENEPGASFPARQ